MDKKENDRLVPIQVIAEILNISPLTIRRWMKSGLPHYTKGAGSALRFDIDEVKEWYRAEKTRK